MDNQEIGIKKLDKPMLYNTMRIQEGVLNPDHGKKITMNEQATEKVKEQLLRLVCEVRKENMLNNIVLWFILIAFSCAAVLAWVCVVGFSPRRLMYELPTLIVVESFLWIPAMLIYHRRQEFVTAVQKGEIFAYQYKLQKKLVYSYCTDGGEERIHLFQLDYAYAKVSSFYEAIRCGTDVTLYIVHYKGNRYFAMPGW